jgi:hypothetical protein
LSIIDLFLHEGRIKAPYGLLLCEWILAVLKFAADVSILAGAHWVISRQLFGRVKRAKAWLVTGDFLLLVVAAMSLYYLGSLLASQILWLQVGDLDLMNLVTVRRDQFEAAFAILQALTAFLISGEAATSFWCEWNEEGTVPNVSFGPDNNILEVVALTETL